MSEYPKVDIPENCCDGKKNEYLEKIKELLDDGCFDCCTNQYPVSRDSVKEVWAIAERMAEEIERLKKHEKELNVKLSLYNTAYWEHPSGDMTGTKQLQEMNAEIARLKAELEKRPEVVRCVECKHKEWCRKSINKDGHGDMCPLSFCSAGQHRESEEGK